MMPIISIVLIAIAAVMSFRVSGNKRLWLLGVCTLAGGAVASRWLSPVISSMLLLILLVLIAVPFFLLARVRSLNLGSPEMREFLATAVVLTAVISLYLLTVWRSDGAERYQADLERVIGPQKAVTISSKDMIASGKLCIEVKGQETENVASDKCQIAEPDAAAFDRANADIFSHATQLVSLYNAKPASLKKELAEINKRRSQVSRTVPASWWTRIFSQAARNQHKQSALDVRNGDRLEKQLADLEKHFNCAAFQKSITVAGEKYATFAGKGSWQDAYLCLHEAADQNHRFLRKIEKSRTDAVKARQSLLMLSCSPWLFVVLALFITRPALRVLSPHADWYGYPMFVLCTGTGFCLITDLSLNYLDKMRFLALNNAYYLGCCYALLVITFFVMTHNRFNNFVANVIVHPTRCFIVLAVGGLLISTLMGLTNLYNKSYATSELFKALFLLAAAWFAALRGDYISVVSELSEDAGIGRRRNRLISLLIGPFHPLVDRFSDHLIGVTFLVIVSFTGFLLFHDFGPLLIVLLVFIIFIYLLLGLRSLVYIAFYGSLPAAFFYLFRVPLSRVSVLSHVYERFYEMAAPFTFGSGEISKIIWLQKAAGLFGFVGKIPYYGYVVDPARQIIVTPAQIQSDYTTTHLIAEFGSVGFFIGIIVYFVWLHLTLKKATGALAGNLSGHERFKYWLMAMGLIMLEVQATITVAGNLSIFPLTGVTFPFVSFGFASLLFCSMIFAISRSCQVVRHE